MLFHSSIRKELGRSFGATLVVLVTVVMTMTSASMMFTASSRPPRPTSRIATSSPLRESVRKVGECTMVGFDGLALPSDVKKLIREFGVGQAILFGTERAMRVWIDPAKLLGYQLSAADVTAAIRSRRLPV